MNRVKRLHLPYLTPSGKTCYFAGLFAVGLWYTREQRSLLMLGGLLFVGAGMALVVTWRSLRDLDVSLRRPRVARAFEPSPVEVTVESPRALSGLLVVDPMRPTLGATVHMEKVIARQPTRDRGFETFTRRGMTRTGALAFSCARPLGLAVSERRYGETCEVLVLPPLGELAGPLKDLSWQGRREDQRPIARRGQGAETLYLRTWHPGDSMRRIHWRASARTGEMMIREFEDERGGLLVLGLGGRGAGSALTRRLLEAAISMTATVLHQAARRHRDVLLVLPGEPEPLSVPAGRRAALRAAEEALARLSGDPGWPEFSTVPDSAARCATILIHPGRHEPPVVPPGVEMVSADESVRRGWFKSRGSYAP